LAIQDVSNCDDSVLKGAVDVGLYKTIEETGVTLSAQLKRTVGGGGRKKFASLFTPSTILLKRTDSRS
jgi:hypothetical protein